MTLLDDAAKQSQTGTWRPGPRHIHEQVRDKMYDAIVRPGKAGDQVPAERELARTFGVSTMTISRALKALQDEGHLERLPGKGTFLRSSGNRAAHPARVVSPPEVLGLPWERPAPALPEIRNLNTWIITNLSEKQSERLVDQWTHRAATAMERAIQGAGGRTTLIDFGVGRELHPYATVEEAMDAGVNSVALFHGIDQNESCRALMQQLIRTKIHSPGRLSVVEISTASKSSWPFDCVRYDNEWGVYLAVEHLTSLGHTRIAFVGDIALPWAQKRLDAYHVALETCGLSFSAVAGGPLIFEGNSTSNVDWNVVSDRFANDFLTSDRCRQATAAITLNDQSGIPFQAAMLRAGMKLPHDLSIVSFDDDRASISAGLTTTHAPIEEAGERAVRLLASRLRSPFTSGREEIVLNPTLVVRTSTGTPRTDA